MTNTKWTETKEAFLVICALPFIGMLIAVDTGYALPDLVVTSLTIDNDSLVQPESTTIRWTIQNIGNTDATPVNYYFRVHLCTTDNYDDLKKDVAGRQITISLSPQEQHSSTFNFNSSSYPIGNWYLVAKVDATDGDPDGIVSESSETNNTRGNLPITIEAPHEYTVSGYVKYGTGTGFGGVTVTLTGDGAPQTRTTQASGYYSFAGIPNGTGYQVTASLSGWTFDNSPQTFTVSGANKSLTDMIGHAVENIGRPGTPSGEINAILNLVYSYSTSGATSNLGHGIEYQFDWGDGNFSSWSTSTNASHYWTSTGVKQVRVTARCQTHNDKANTSDPVSVNVTVEQPPQTEPPDQINQLLGFLEWLGFGLDPVNTATGNFFHSETDITIPSRGLPLVFSRHYNSRDTRNGSLGIGWTHSYYIYLQEEPNLVSVHWGDGRTDYWNPNGLGGYEPNTLGLYDSLTKNGSNWRLTRKTLDTYVFDSAGILQSIADKNGDTITLSYSHPSDPNLATSIIDAAGRTLTLSYTGGLLTTVTDFASPARTVQYGYTSGRFTQVIDILGNTVDYTYDANGYLSVINDQRDVNTVRNVYDANGRVIEQLDGNGNRSAFAYDTPEPNKTTITDPNGKSTIQTYITGYKLLHSIQNPLGATVNYGYDESGNRIYVTDRNGNTTSFLYDNRGNVIRTTNSDAGITIVDYNDPNFPDLPTKKTDANDFITQWWYDSNANVIRQLNPNGYERTWTYNTFGQKLTETDENGHTAQFIYDSNGLLTETIDPNGNHTWFGYDTLWRPTHITDGRALAAGDPCHTTITTYDKTDRVISITRPVTGESYQYDKVGNRTAVTNGRGYTTIYRYDNCNNLTKIERPAPEGQTQITEYVYDELNRKIRTIDPNGNTTTYQYDAAGRLLKETNPEGNETTYTNDPHGNILSVTDGNGVTTFYEYDPMHRKVGQYDELGNHWYWQYNKLGQLTKHTDAMGYKTNYEYDCLGRLIHVIDESNKVTQYKYDPVGNLTEIIDAAGITIERRFYDTANRLIRKEDALGNAYEYSYDGAGNQSYRKDANGNITTYVYDNQNRLTEVHYPDSNQVTYTYDDNGNLLTMTDPTGTTTYTYDELDRLTSSMDSFGKTVLYGYDIIGNRTNVTYPADLNNPARTVLYTYDRASRLDKIIDWTGRIWDYNTDGAGRIIEVNVPNALRELRSYDPAGRLSKLIYKDANDANVITYGYTRDAQGNPTGISDTGTLEPIIDLPLREDYTYDEDNRLVETTKPAAYEYDDSGNTTSRTASGITTAFTYDYENRLISQVTDASTVQHTYDGQGNRMARNDNGSVNRYVLDRGRSMSHILCETDGSGNITAYYIHGPQILGRISTDGSVRYYHTDHIGSVTALSDQDGLITDRYAYTPFGVPTGREGTTINPFTYVGGLGVMAESDGLYFIRARFYDRDLGRFLTKDPIDGSVNSPQSLHHYVYLADNPLLLADPSGLFWGEVLEATGHIMAAGVGSIVTVPAGLILHTVSLVPSGLSALQYEAATGASALGWQGLASSLSSASLESANLSDRIRAAGRGAIGYGYKEFSLAVADAAKAGDFLEPEWSVRLRNTVSYQWQQSGAPQAEAVVETGAAAYSVLNFLYSVGKSAASLSNERAAASQLTNVGYRINMGGAAMHETNLFLKIVKEVIFRTVPYINETRVQNYSNAVKR